MSKKVDIRLYAGALSKIQELQAKLSGESFVSHEHYSELQMERDQLAARVAELESLLSEAVDLFEDIRSGEYSVDSFTTQPYQVALVRSKPASLARHDAEVLRTAIDDYCNEGGHITDVYWLSEYADRIEQEADK